MDTSQYVPGMGYSGARLMILGESPGVEELRAGKPFVGPSGRELDKLLKEAGIDRNETWITNVCKYFVPPSMKGDKIPFAKRAELYGIDIPQQLRELQSEINSIKPNCILGLGGTALWALSGKTKITNYRGSILHGLGSKFVCTYHPAHLLHSADSELKGYYNRTVMIFDFKRAYEEARTSELSYSRRTLTVCRNSGQLYDFFKRYKDYTKPSVDIEALNCIPSCIGIAFTPYEGISIPLWNKHGISNISDSDLVSCWMYLSEILSKSEVVGQNFKYDQDKIRRIGFIIKRLASDTMLKAFAINPELPKGLAFNTSIYTREPYYKDEGSDFDISKQSIDDLFIYNARDACVTKEIDLAMDKDIDEVGTRDYYENFILPLHDLYLDIENVGFRVDEEKRDKLIEKYIKWDEQETFDLYKLVGSEINPNSHTQVKDLLWREWKLPPKPTTGEDDLFALLNSPHAIKNKDHREGIEKIIRIRKIRKTYSTYLMALPDYDGRMRTTYYLCLDTGRTSTGQQDPPIRPTIELKDIDGKKKKRALGMAFQTMTKHGDIGADIREQFVPDKGEIFVQADSSQAEARVIFLLADDEQALKDIDEHDYHALTASWFFGGTESDYSKKILGYESPIRFAGKTLRHAGHLGARARRAATSVNTDCRKYGIKFQISEATADYALKIFHNKQPKIQGVFQNGIIECLKRDNRYITAAVPYGINARLGGRRQFFERYGDELFRQAFSYVPQRSVSDNTKSAALRIKGQIPSIKIIMESHDALLFSIPERHTNNWIPIIKQEMERPIRFDTCSLSRRDLIIPCEIEVGYDYRNLSKFKEVKVA